ncbi:hypothetical protein, partial [Methylicorpusculum sp.]|uniref:hypothetical protein n=1 Tax=Methylicorpusculum sp. TaxID=2713644 RepID=UPI002ABCBCB6
ITLNSGTLFGYGLVTFLGKKRNISQAGDTGCDNIGGGNFKKGNLFLKSPLTPLFQRGGLNIVTLKGHQYRP